MTARKRTPEGEAQALIVEYLKFCNLGKVKRNNVGQARMGEAPKHPWAKDTRRVVRFGEVGESDLEVELTGQPRSLFVEVKPLGWNPPQEPRPGSAASTWKKYRHHLDQVAFQTHQRARGHFAIFARSPREVYEQLTALGFQGLPVPRETPKPVRASRCPR